MRKPALYIATRNVLTGHLSGIEAVGDDLGFARRAAQERADTMLTGSVWLTTGHPSDQYAAVLEAFPATRV